MENYEYPDPLGFPRSTALYQNLQSFADRMQSGSKLTDGFLTARVVGEFSAGKTRLLSELFGDLIPEQLFPISSLERQTRLQLEITYAESPSLTLIEREQDYKPAQLIKTLSNFPDRQEVTGLNPMKYRLRLAVNEPRLILHEGDGYGEDKSPKRLFLIDTPGWNSGDDELAEQQASSILMGYHNLALIYVTQAARLDGALNAEHLRDFMAALADADFLDMDQAKLIFVITNCPADDAPRFQRRAQDLVHRLWSELNKETSELSLDVFCVDFHEIPNNTLQQFRDFFWSSLLKPLKQSKPAADPWVTTLRLWPDKWDIRPLLLATQKNFIRAETLLTKVCKDDEFVVGMNMYRLIGLDSVEIRKKVRATWLKQLGSDKSVLEDWTVIGLPEDHPLYDWYQHFWQQQLQQAMLPIKEFFDMAFQAIDNLTPDVKDLQAFLRARLTRPHTEALFVLGSSFAQLAKTVQELITEPEVEKRISTLCTLSLLQARYEDYYAKHTATLTGVVRQRQNPRKFQNIIYLAGKLG